MSHSQAPPRAPSKAASSRGEPVRHVVFIGETGSGKSSVINLILGQPSGPAEVSPDVKTCTADVAHYDIVINGEIYRLWDTPGFNEPSGIGRIWWRKTPAVHSVRKLLRQKQRDGELHLLVFCFEGKRTSKAMTGAYEGFCRPTRCFAGPVVIVVTHLEKQQPTMETWWQKNERELGRLGLTFDGHACLTCLSPHHRRRASRDEICHLISTEYPLQAAWSVPSEEYMADNKCIIC